MMLSSFDLDSLIYNLKYKIITVKKQRVEKKKATSPKVHKCTTNHFHQCGHYLSCPSRYLSSIPSHLPPSRAGETMNANSVISLRPRVHPDMVRGDNVHLFWEHKGGGEPGQIGSASADGHTLLIVTMLVMWSIHNELQHHHHPLTLPVSVLRRR